MTTFSKIIVVCPFCKSTMYDFELMSYTVHENTCYSDGKCTGSVNQFGEKEIGICYDCEKPFWKQDALSDEDPYSFDDDELPQVKDMMDLLMMKQENFQLEIIQFYQKLIENGFPNTIERKSYLRLRLWWSINDLIRNQLTLIQMIKSGRISPSHLKRFYEINKQSRADFKSLRTTFNENLEKLAPLMIKDPTSDLLMLAEIYREQGNFKQAFSALKKLENKKGKAFRKIWTATILQRKKVFCLN